MGLSEFKVGARRGDSLFGLQLHNVGSPHRILGEVFFELDPLLDRFCSIQYIYKPAVSVNDCPSSCFKTVVVRQTEQCQSMALFVLGCQVAPAIPIRQILH